MGRGRQKAKQMKVARRLKYSVHETDLDALQRELSGVPDDQIDFDDGNQHTGDPYEELAGLDKGSGTTDRWDEDSWVNPEAQ